MLFPSVCDLGEDFVVCKDFRNGLVPWKLLKIVLESPHRTNVASHQLDSDSEVSTDQENPEYFEKFYLQFCFKKEDETTGKFGFKNEDGKSGVAFKRVDGSVKMSFIDRKGSAFDFKDRTIARLESHLSHKESADLMPELQKAKEFISKNGELFSGIVISVVLVQIHQEDPFKLILMNPSSHESSNFDTICEGLEELSKFLEISGN